MITNYYKITCNGCGVGCGGIFERLETAEELRERLGWARIILPVRVGASEVIVGHYCSSCWRAESMAVPSRVVST